MNWDKDILNKQAANDTYKVGDQVVFINPESERTYGYSGVIISLDYNYLKTKLDIDGTVFEISPRWTDKWITLKEKYNGDIKNTPRPAKPQDQPLSIDSGHNPLGGRGYFYTPNPNREPNRWE